MALVGYARTSTTDQKAGLESQIRDLDKAGCKEIFSEEISSVAKLRPTLDECLRFLRKNDIRERPHPQSAIQEWPTGDIPLSLGATICPQNQDVGSGLAVALSEGRFQR